MTAEHFDKAHPVSAPWMISPSVSGLRISIVENGDAAVTCDVAMPPSVNDTGGELVNRPVVLLFRSGQWVRTHPAASDDETIPSGMFDDSDIPFRRTSGSALDTMLEDFRSRWIETQECPDPGVYEIRPSAWLRETGAERFGCRHYVISGRDMWVEVLCLGFTWRWSESQPTDAIEASAIDWIREKRDSG